MKVTDGMVEAAYVAWQASVRADRDFGNREAIRDALEAALALSHAAGQDGEQCRAASGDFDDAYDFANHLAQEIRRVDGNHSLSASALADAVTPFIIRALSRGVPDGKA